MKPESLSRIIYKFYSFTVFGKKNLYIKYLVSVDSEKNIYEFDTIDSTLNTIDHI